MAKINRKKVSAGAVAQAPVGAWTPGLLRSALKTGTPADRVRALKQAGILEAKGNVTKIYKTNWRTKVTRTPSATQA